MTLKNISEKQGKVLGWCQNPISREKYSVIICDGAVRSGKTVCMVISFVHWAMRFYNGSIFGICGKTVQSAERNIITPIFEMSDITEYYSLSYTRSTKLLTVAGKEHTNSFYIFGGKDESSYMLIQGITLSGVLFDEVALMPRSFVEQAIARTVSVEDSKLWFNCNPESPNHWFYNEWIKKKQPDTLHLHFLMSDNPIMTKKAIEKAERRFAGVFYDRYIKGLWVLAEGLVYPMFNEKEHVVREVPEAGRYFISIDYGTLNPCSMGLWCLNGKQAVRIAEYYHSGRDTQKQLTDEEYYQALEKLAGERYIEYVVVDPSAASFITCIQKHRKFRVRKAKNEVVNGIRVTTTMLQNKNILFHESCRNTIKEFGLYRWDDKATEDRVIKENDHCLVGNSIVHTPKGDFEIKELVGKTGKIYCYNESDKALTVSDFFHVRKTQESVQVYEIELENGTKIKATAEHPFLTETGWKMLKELSENDRIVCIGGFANGNNLSGK
ncbi:PBSX family phage terminase large subunit [Massiliimalia timonensis]|uniref:PBSX family phage terminase large subunit n=1 Tax=Massiliimalia timonensis TaxID=1987501 RepID=UPI00189CDCF1|nr:PBSX family phage terminase large subunit [Massiliimalia timonensis]